MGGTSQGSSSGKTGSSTNNTGSTNWSSGATGNNGSTSPTGQTTNNTATNTANTQQNQAAQPGTDAYNSMNTQLSTSPMQALVNLFSSGGNSQDAQNVINNLLGSSGSNSWMNSAADAFSQLGTTGTQNFQDLYNKAGQAGANEKYLTDYASGKMLNSNPYVDAITNRAQQDAATNVNQMFSAGGRYGSGMDQGTVAKAVADANNQYRGQAYENDANRQLQASGAISNEQQGRMGIQGQAASGVGNLQSTAAQGLGQLGQNSMSNWLNAQQTAGNMANQGTQNMLNGMNQLSNVQNNKMFDSNTQTNVGNQTTQSSQDTLNSLINQWNQGDMSGWQRLGALLSGTTGSAGNYGTSSSSTKQSSSSGIGSIIGGLLSLL